MSRGTRLLYLTQWFDPEPGVIKGTAFVRALVNAGYDVTVVTGFPNYPEGKLYPGYRMRLHCRETIGGVAVTRIPLYPSHNSSSVGRALNFLSFFASALAYGLLRAQRFDLIYVYHPPITVGLAAALFGWFRRRRFILEIQDLWPDTILASGMAGTTIARVLGLLCRFTYQRAHSIIVQSEGMRAKLIERGVPAAKVNVVRNWADAAAASISAPVVARPAGTPLKLLYAGNLGRMQALEVVVDAVERANALRPALSTELVLLGDGIEAANLRRHVATTGATAVRFAPRVPVADLSVFIGAADIMVLHLSDDPLFEITIPSKTQFYLASGKPILAGISGEAASLLRQSGAAIVAPPGDRAAIADAIAKFASMTPGERDQMGTNGRAFYDTHLSFDRGMVQTLALIAAARDAKS